MNHQLRNYLRRLNHTQRLLTDADGRWLWLQETGAPLNGVIRVNGVSVDGKEIATWNGSQVSALLLRDGRVACALVKDNAAQLRWVDRPGQVEDIWSSKSGELLIGNVVEHAGQLLLPWACQCGAGAGRVGISVRAGGTWRHITLCAARNAFAPHMAARSDGTLHLVWSAADQRMYYATARLDTIDQNIIPRCIGTDGYQPTLLLHEDNVLITYESHFSYPKSILITDGVASTAQPVSGDDPRFHYSISHSLQLIRDPFGVPLLFFAERYRAQVFYSRWLGETWSPVLSVPALYHRSPRDDTSYAQIRGVYAAAQADVLGNAVLLSAENPEVKSQLRRIVPVSPDNGGIRFYDLRDIAKMRGFQHRVQRGVKREENPLLQNGPPGTFNSQRGVNRCTVLHDGQQYRIWLTGTSIPDSEIGYEWWTKLRSGMTTSDDGIHWKPPREIDGLPGQHAICSDGCGSSDNQRYKFVDFLIADQKLIAAQAGVVDPFRDSEAGRLFYSNDGLEWEQRPIELHSPGGAWFEHCPMCLLDDDDDAPHRWKSYGYASLTLGRRANSLATSSDLIHWTLQPEPVLPPELHGYPWQPAGPLSQVHGMTVHRIDGIYIGFVQYQQDASRSTIELAVSRDGRHFDPVQAGNPLIDRGVPGGWDEGMLMPAGLVEGPDGWRLYYTGTDLPAAAESIRTSLGAAEFLPQGLCALETTADVAMLQTVPVAVRPDENYSLCIHSTGLQWQIEIVDAKGAPIAQSQSVGGPQSAVQFSVRSSPVSFILRATTTTSGKIYAVSIHPTAGSAQ